MLGLRKVESTRSFDFVEVNMISIKRAEKADAEEITQIKIAAFNKEINTYLGRDGGPPGYDRVESELDIIENHLAYKILLDERIIGGFFLYYEGDDILHFEDFVINPEYQGNGYGYGTAQPLVGIKSEYLERFSGKSRTCGRF